MKRYMILAVTIAISLIFSVSGYAQVTDVSNRMRTDVSVEGGSPSASITTNSTGTEDYPTPPVQTYMNLPTMINKSVNYWYVMDVWKLLRHQAVFTRAELKRLAEGGKYDEYVRPLNGASRSFMDKKDSDMIVVVISEPAPPDPKAPEKGGATYMGPASGNAKAKTNSYQAFALLLLDAMDRNMNIIMIDARIISDMMMLEALGLNLWGGGVSKQGREGLSVNGGLGKSYGEGQDVKSEGYHAEGFFDPKADFNKYGKDTKDFIRAEMDRVKKAKEEAAKKAKELKDLQDANKLLEEKLKNRNLLAVLAPVSTAPVCSMSTDKILFDFNKSFIRKDMWPVIKRMVGFLNANPACDTVIVETGCDERGTKQVNAIVGDQRADAMMQAFAKEGLSPKIKIRFVTSGKRYADPKNHDGSRSGTPYYMYAVTSGK